jgi:hypothetical protein
MISDDLIFSVSLLDGPAKDVSRLKKCRAGDASSFSSYAGTSQVLKSLLCHENMPYYPA